VSVPHFEEMLRDVLRKTTAKRVYLLAHSMGNRILIASLKDIAQTEPQLLRGREIFETILAAPDVTADVFRNNIAGILSRAPMGVTLYGSSNDEALKVSKGIHKLNRAGEGGSKMVLMKGVESIDASSVETDFLGHSYFAQSPSVVGDISDLIVQRQRAASRRWLRKAGSKTTPIPYWQFRAN
jgi:esterase/lipase superfamily enzyme